MSVDFVENDFITDTITVIESERFQDVDRVKQKTVVYQHKGGPPQYKHQLIKPQIPLEFWEMMHDFSMFLIVDDRHDLGHFTYYDRKGHFYRNAPAPHHPSPFHHWQVGILGLFMSQIGALVTKALEIKGELALPQKVPEKFIVQKERKLIDLVPKGLPAPSPEPKLYDRLTSVIDAL